MPPRPEAPPTIASVYNLLAGLAGQMGGLRTDVDTVLLRLPAPPGPRSSIPPSDVIVVPDLPSPESLAPPSRPSMAAKAIQGAKSGSGKAGKWLVWASGGLMLVGQAISFAGRPELGPAVTSIKVIGGALLELARSMGGAP